MKNVDEVVVQVEEEGEEVTGNSDAEIKQSLIIESIKKKKRRPVDRKKTYSNSFTIHKVDPKLRDGNDNAYNPQLVSIGPYHYGNENFKDMQDVKSEYLNDLIKRSSGDPLPQYIAVVSSKATKAKKQYSGAFSLDPHEFVEMMVVDGCFLIEFMLKSYLNDWKNQLNIVKTKMPLLMNDLLLVENQIPLFILKDLLEMYKQLDNNLDKNDDSFTIEVLALFCFTGDRLAAQLGAKLFKDDKKSFHHLLHLYHSSLSPAYDRNWKEEQYFERFWEVITNKNGTIHNCVDCLSYSALGILILFMILIIVIFNLSWHFISYIWDWTVKLLLLPSLLYLRIMKYLSFGTIGGDVQWKSGIPNARYLRDTGFNFKKNDTSCFLDVSRSGRTIKIPGLCIQRTTTTHYKNLIAFEHSSRKLYGHEFTAYAKFMDYLIDTEEDVAILRECDIIDNRLGKDEEVATFFNNLLNGIHIKDKDVPMFPYVRKYYTKGYYKIKFFQKRKKLVSGYFSNPWAVPWMITASIMLVLTVLQTFYTVYPYYNPR